MIPNYLQLRDVWLMINDDFFSIFGGTEATAVIRLCSRLKFSLSVFRFENGQ